MKSQKTFDKNTSLTETTTEILDTTGEVSLQNTMQPAKTNGDVFLL